MGLPLDHNGRAAMEPTSHEMLFVDVSSQEETAFNALLYLMCRAVNCEHSDESQRQRFLNIVEADLEAWHRAVFFSLRPDGELPTPTEPGQDESNSSSPQEQWYSGDRYAVASAFYHMTSIILTVQRPIESFRNLGQSNVRTNPAPFDLLRAMSTVQQALAKHAKEIIPIALAAPRDAVRVRLIQPLYIAGRSFSQKPAQRMLLRLLGDIESDLGVFTRYRINDLLGEWGLAD
jgi:hypothetical protein